MTYQITERNNLFGQEPTPTSPNLESQGTEQPNEWIRSVDIDGNMWEVRGNCSRRICSPTELNSLPSNTDVVQDMNQNNCILHDNSYHNGSDIGEVLQNKTYQEVIEEGRNNPNCKGVTYNNRRGCGWLHEQIIPNKIINANNPETPHTHRHNWHTLCIFPDRP